MMLHLTLKSVSGPDTEHLALLALRVPQFLFECSTSLALVVLLDSHCAVNVASSVVNIYVDLYSVLGAFPSGCFFPLIWIM